jgi:SOS-response transcriptional repressor LexA
MDKEEIRARMKARGLQQVDLANALGVTPVTISKSLGPGGTRPFKYHEMKKLEALLADPAGEVEGTATVMIPVIGQVVAGTWREEVQRPLGHMAMDRTSTPPRSFALEVDGDSMDLEIASGGRVVVDPDDKALFPGRLYVVINQAGETTFKQYAEHPARLEPRSTNPVHQPIAIGEEPFTLIGRVTALYRTR